jgi:two-component system chemotaxis response regulator CheB
VKLAAHGEHILAGTVYVAPADHHLIVKNDHLRVTRGPRENQWRPAIDVLLRSAAVTFGLRVMAVLLSGALDEELRESLS